MTRSPISERTPRPRILRSPRSEVVPAALAVIAGASFGASAWIAFGFYDQSVWGPLALVWLALLLGLAISRPALPGGASLAAAGGLLTLGVWALISTRWAESSYAALVDADRLLFYAAVLLALL